VLLQPTHLIAQTVPEILDLIRHAILQPQLQLQLNAKKIVVLMAMVIVDCQTAAEELAGAQI